MTRLLLSIALATVLTSTARAQELPPDVAADVKRAQAQCDGRFSAGKGFIARPDINGDKVPDVVVNFHHGQCNEMPSVFCGTGGCLIQVFASVGDGKYTLVMDRPAYKVRFARRHGVPAMIQHIHGGNCGRTGGGGGCEAVTYWNGGEFTPAYPLR